MTQLINPILIYQSPTKAAPQFLLKLFLSLKSKIGWLHWFFIWSDLMGSIWKWFCADTLKHSQENKVKIMLMFEKTLKAWSSFAKDCLQVSKLSTFLYFSKVSAGSLSSATKWQFYYVLIQFCKWFNREENSPCTQGCIQEPAAGEVHRLLCQVSPATFMASRVKISRGGGPTTVYFSHNSGYLKT